MQAFRKTHLEAKRSFRDANIGTMPDFDSEFCLAPDTVIQKQLFSLVPVYHKDLQPLFRIESGHRRPEEECMFPSVSVTKDKKDTNMQETTPGCLQMSS